MDGFNIHLSKGHMLYELAHAIFRQGLGNLGPQLNAKVYEGRCSLLKKKKKKK